MQNIYFDYAATTPLDNCVATAVSETQKKLCGNPSSVHYFGQKSKGLIEKVRGQIAEQIGAGAGEIIFSSGGTESNNLALTGFALANRDKGEHIISTPIEHPSVLKTLEFLQQIGFEVSWLTVSPAGRIDPEELSRKITPGTILVSVMSANNETGSLINVEELARVTARHKISFHSDAVQLYGKADINVANSGIGLMAFSGHKIYGPKGIGILYKKQGIKLNPIIHGGSQERNLRAGTENLAAIAGLSEAVNQLTVNKPERKRIKKLRDQFEEMLTEAIPQIKINGVEGERLFSHSNIYFPGAPGDSMLLRLDMEGIAASSGSACSSGSVQPSHVLKALGYDEKRCAGSLRFSFGRFTTEEEIKSAVPKIQSVYNQIVKR